MRLFDRKAAQPKPATVTKLSPAPTTKKKVGRKPGAMPRIWQVGCYRTFFEDRQSEVLFEKAYSYRRTAEKVLAHLCETHKGDNESAVEFSFCKKEAK